MNKKNKGIQVGNFIVAKEQGNEHDWISIKAISGFWTLRFRDDNGMFARIRSLANDKQFHAYLETYIKVVYLISNTTPDVDFFKEFFHSYDELSERLRNFQKQPTPEEEAKVLEEEKVVAEMKESLNP